MNAMQRLVGRYQDSFSSIWARKLSDSQTMLRVTVAPMAT